METPNDCRLMRVLTALCCEPWLLTPQMHRTLTDIARGHAFGGADEARQHAIADAMPVNAGPSRYAVLDVSDPDPASPTGQTKVGTVASIPIDGVIGRKFSSMLQSSGVTSIDVFQRLVTVAADDSAVDAIVIAIDSPGGVAMGTPEAAEAVARAERKKPVIAYADGLCCSAAYWIASQASAIFATPSADVGSIGAYLAVLDYARAAEIEGIRVELFRSGKHKGMGYPGTSLSDEQRDMLREQVVTIADKFKAAVERGRNRKIPQDAMQGQSFAVEEASRLGLIDNTTDMDTALREAVRLAKIRAKGIRK